MLFGRSLLLLGAVFILAAGGYLMLYNRSINRRIRQHTGGVRLPSPGRITVHLLVICTACAIAAGCFLSASEPVHVQGAQSWLRVFTAEELPGSWAGVYSQDINPGYTRREVQDSAFSFIIFESDAPHDGLHPDFLVFFRPHSDSSLEAVSWHGNFEFTASEQSSGLGAGGCASEYFLAVGSAAESAVFTLTAAAYSDAESAKSIAEMTAGDDALPAPDAGRSSVSIRLHH